MVTTASKRKVDGVAIEAVLRARGKWPPPFRAAVVCDEGGGAYLAEWDAAALGPVPTDVEIVAAVKDAPRLRVEALAKDVLERNAADWRALCGVWLWERTGKKPTAKEVGDEWATFSDRFVQIYKALSVSVP